MGLLDFITGGNGQSKYSDVPFGLRLMVAGNMASQMAQGQAPTMGGYVAMEEARRNAIAQRQEEEEYKKRMAMAVRMASKLRETNPLMADAIEQNPDLIEQFLPKLVDRQFQEQDYQRDRADKLSDTEAARRHAFEIQDDSQAAQAERDRLSRGWSQEDAATQYERDLAKEREKLQMEENARKKRIEEILGPDFFNTGEKAPGPQSSNEVDEYGISPVARAALTPKPLPTEEYQVASLGDVPVPSTTKPAATQVAEAAADKITTKVRTMFDDDSITPSEAKLIMYKFLQDGDLGDASEGYNQVLDNRTNKKATSSSEYALPDGAFKIGENPNGTPIIDWFPGTEGWKRIQEQKAAEAKAATEAEETAKKEKASEALAKVGSLKVIKTIGEAKERVASGIQGAKDNVFGIDTVTGPVGGLIAGLPGVGPSTEAGRLAAEIQTINANQAFDQLKAMRDASSSGASGLGQVTEFEQKMLMSVNEYLQQAASGEDLYERLGNLELWYTAALQSTDDDPTKSVLQSDIDTLRSEPTPENVAEFENIYGKDTAAIVLVEQ